MCEVCIARTGGGARMGPQQARRSLAAASRAGQTGPMLIWLTLLASIVVAVHIFWGLLLFTVAACGPVFEPVAGAGNGDDLGVMKEPIQDRGGRGNIAEMGKWLPVHGRAGGTNWLVLLIPHHRGQKEPTVEGLSPNSVCVSLNEESETVHLGTDGPYQAAVERNGKVVILLAKGQVKRWSALSFEPVPADLDKSAR